MFYSIVDREKDSLAGTDKLSGFKIDCYNKD